MRTDRRTDRQPDMKKLMVDFRNFADAPNQWTGNDSTKQIKTQIIGLCSATVELNGSINIFNDFRTKL
jgi:hypothetical protein